LYENHAPNAVAINPSTPTTIPAISLELGPLSIVASPVSPGGFRSGDPGSVGVGCGVSEELGVVLNVEEPGSDGEDEGVGGIDVGVETGPGSYCTAVNNLNMPGIGACSHHSAEMDADNVHWALPVIEEAFIPVVVATTL
jgi:hypothetical protein